jgi:hypothetical protein
MDAEKQTRDAPVGSDDFRAVLVDELTLAKAVIVI